MDCQRPIFFHYVPSRNKIIQGNKATKGFAQVFSKQELNNQRGWREVDKNATYSTYLQLLRTVKSCVFNCEIYHLEMTLFRVAPDWCARLVNSQLECSL